MPLHHAGTQILKTKRLVLRPFSLDDAQAMYDNWDSDPQVTRFMNWSTHESIEVTRTILAEWVPQYQDPSYYHWCITLDGEPVGTIAILNIQERSMVGELGYNIGRKWWRQGITSEAAQAVLDFAFGVVGFHRIEAIHAVANPGSGGVMKKCGMRYEGSPRQKYLSSRGIFEDCDQYAILREDWEQPGPKGEKPKL